MRSALAGFVACALIAACATTSGDVSPSTSSTSIAPPTTTATTVPTTTTTAPTTTTTVIGSELLDGGLMAAWNRGDMKGYWSFFADDALWLGQRPGSDDLADWLEFLQAIGWRIAAADCEHPSEGHATCTTTYTDDIAAQVGIEMRLDEHYFFDDEGLITSYGSYGGTETPGAEAFGEAFDMWLGITYPELAEQWLVDDGYPTEEICGIAIAAAGEFLEAFPQYRIGTDPIVPEPVLTGSLDGVDVYNADSRQTALVSWALTRFVASGLESPPVTAVRFPPTEACLRSFSGVTIHGNEGSMIDVCVAPEDLAIAVGFPLDARRTILHELGHVWNAHVATETERQVFLDSRGLEEWSASVWQESGSEQAAEIIMWGVMDMNVLPRVPNATCPERHAAFEILTGIPAAERLSDCTGDS
ncbi:MAG: hypothetical protein ABFS21_09530 [Actinomycetota bacterium]